MMLRGMANVCIPVDNPVTKICVIVWTVICMIVRCEEVNVETFEVHLTYSQALASKPVSMQQLVRVPIEAKLMEGAVVDPNLGQYCCSSPNNAVVKIMGEGKLLTD